MKPIFRWSFRLSIAALAAQLVIQPFPAAAQSPDDALAVQQEIERVPDIGHEYIGARHRLDGTTLARIDGNREAPGIPDRCQPQSFLPLPKTAICFSSTPSRAR